jgi:hypothetical protein
MAEPGKPRTRAGAKKAADNADPTNWFCKNCGETNSLDASECLHCGFTKDFDPEARPSVDFSAISATLEQQAEQRRRQLQFILELVKNALLLILVTVFLILGFRLMSNWPFQGPYEQDSLALLDAVLAVQSRVELGVTKGQYDELLVQLMVENTKFKLKYGESVERQKESYQKLTQAAGFYELASGAWANQLTGADRQARADANARSEAVNEEVQRCWDNGKRNALLALQDLR